jgi:hypothetical protein
MLAYINVGKNEWRYECLDCGKEAVVYSGHVKPLNCAEEEQEEEE